jgi:tRNA U38,U39,U40 pseudouridine synthase TruA
VGLSKVGLEEFRRIMVARKVGLAGPTAPPYGLYLTKVNYPADLELKYENLCN